MTNPYFYFAPAEYPTRARNPAAMHAEPSPYAVFSDCDIDELLEEHGDRCAEEGCELRAHLQC